MRSGQRSESDLSLPEALGLLVSDASVRRWYLQVKSELIELKYGPRRVVEQQSKIAQ